MVGAQVDYVSLAKQGIPVLKPIYLNDFLISDKPPDLERFLLDVYKPHWESIKKRNRICTDTPTSASKKTNQFLDMFKYGFNTLIPYPYAYMDLNIIISLY